jgi:CheY-like chemotaxis protein
LETNRNILLNVLAPLGFELSEARDGQEALNQAHECCPDLIFMDIRMPVMDGLECTYRLRQEQIFQGTVIIVLSASVFTQDRDKSLAQGSNAFLEKPVNMEKLFQLMAQYLHLEWIYETSPFPPQNSIPSTTTSSLILPNVAQLTELFDFAQSGKIQHIIQKTEELQKDSPQLQNFTEELLQLAKGFQLKKIKELLRQGLQETLKA